VPFTASFVPAELAEALTDEAWLEALLDVERALANARALTGAISSAEAGRIADACVASRFDVAEVGRAADPAESVLQQVRGGGSGPPSGEVVEVATAVVMRRAVGIVVDELERLVSAAPAESLDRAEAAHDRLVAVFRGLTVQIGGDPKAAELAAAQLGLPEGDNPTLDTAALATALVDAASLAAELDPRRVPSARRVRALAPLLLDPRSGYWGAELEPLEYAVLCAGAAIAGAADVLEGA
jgi:hypothetical protein